MFLVQNVPMGKHDIVQILCMHNLDVHVFDLVHVILMCTACGHGLTLL